MPIRGEIIVIDNGSVDVRYTSLIAISSGCKFIALKQNLGVATAWNTGIDKTEGTHLVFVNQDAQIDPGCIPTLIETLSRYKIPAVVGAKLYFPDTRLLQHAGATVLPPRYDGRHIGYRQKDDGQFDSISSVDYVTGAVFACSRRTLLDLHCFDERFAPAYYEDVDFCWRVRKKQGVILYQPKAVGYHEEGSSLGWKSYGFVRMYTRNRLLFVSIHLSDFSQLLGFVSAEVEWLATLEQSQRSLVLEVIREFQSESIALLGPERGAVISSLMNLILAKGDELSS